jgi:flagellar motility protein MotE (MotC chaperone)
MRSAIILAAAVAALLSGAASAEEGGGDAHAPPPGLGDAALAASVEPEPLQMPGTTPEANAAQYCSNLGDAVTDTRVALQAKALEEMRIQLEEQVAALEAKRAEYESWLTRREEFANQAEASVVAIYSQMRPDAAALQIAVMDPGSAAAILAKLSPRTASAILNEMEPAAAAQLTATIAGLANRPPVKEQQG